MTRDRFPCRAVALFASLVAVALVPVVAAEPVSDEEWSRMCEAAKNRPRQVIYENDGDDCLVFPKNREKSIANWLDLRTSYLKNTEVDTVFYTPTEAGFGHVSLKIKNADPLMVKFGPEDNRVNLTPWLFEQGTDTLTEQIKYARENDLEIFVDVRMNDVHDVADRPGAPHILFPPFKRKHPELLFGSWDKPSPYGAWSSLDYGQKAVQDYFIAHVGEILEKYDVDGLSLDFFRQPNLFKSVAWGKKVSPEEREIMTRLMREVRRLADKYGRMRGRPVLIAIRVPDSVDYCMEMGVDLETWFRDGLVDMMIAAGNFHLNPWKYSAELCKKYGVKFYASIDMPQFTPSTGTLSRYSDSSYHARSAAAFAAGADGNYYFNLFNRSAAERLMLKPEQLRLRDKRYHVTDRYLGNAADHIKGGEKFNNLPEIHPHRQVAMASGEKRNFVLEIGDDFEALKRDGVGFEVFAVVEGHLADPSRLQISSGTEPWKYDTSVDGYHYYSVPDGALHQGINKLELELLPVSGDKAAWQTIMKGDKLLLGNAQPPWRRLFDRNDPSTAEKIEDGAYRMYDSGPGCNNLLYPLSDAKYPLSFRFDMRFVNASDERAVVFRAADGNHVEIISFAADKIKLLYSGKSVKFNTADAFHTYEGRFVDGRFILTADGRELFDVPLKMKVGDPRGELSGFIYSIPGMQERSLLYGSLSNEGTGTAYWKNLQLLRPAGTIQLRDFAVEVVFSDSGIQKSPVASWKYQNAGEKLLAVGKHAYSRDLLIAEVDFSAENNMSIVFSNGGSLQRVQVGEGRVAIPSRRPLSLPAGGKFTLRAELEDGTSKFFIGERSSVTGTDYVSGMLSTADYAKLDSATRTLIRNGGIAIIGDAPAAMRANILPPDLPKFPADVQWMFVYDAAFGLPGPEWKNIYQPGAVGIADGVLNLDNRADGARRWSSFNLIDTAKLAGLGRFIVAEMEIANGGELSTETPEFFTFGVAVFPEGEHREMVLRFAPDAVKTSFGNAKADFPVGTFHKVTAVLDTEKGVAALWIDGNFVVGGNSVVDKARKLPGLFWGDCSSSAGGLARMKSVRVGTVK